MQRNCSYQTSFVINAKAGIYGLLINRGGAYIGYRLTDCQMVVKLHHLYGHYRTGTVLRIFEKSVDYPPCLTVRLGEDTANHSRRNLLQEINGIVKKHVVKQMLKLRIGYQAQELGLGIRFQIRKNVRRYILWQDAEHPEKFIRGERLHCLSYINDVHFAQFLAKLCELAFSEHCADIFQDITAHCTPLSPQRGVHMRAEHIQLKFSGQTCAAVCNFSFRLRGLGLSLPKKTHHFSLN